jgi:PAS domain S-box-containing protein
MAEKPTYEELESRVKVLEKEAAWRNRADEALHLEESRLEALLRLNEMTGAALQKITDFALEEAVRLTGSEIGYLAFMNEDETMLTMHSWSRNAMGQCAIPDKPKFYPVETTGLWGEAVRQRKPIIFNDYAAPSPLKKGYPKGHVEIRRHVNIPVFDGTKIVAVAGVGNKKTAYDRSDVRQLKLLMQGMWRLILRKWTEWELRESEAKFRKLVETVGCAIFIYQGTRIYFANQASEAIFGYRPEELVSRNFWDIIHPDDRKSARERGLARQRGEAVPPRYELKILRKNGEVGWCDFTLSMIELEGKSAVLGIALDITENKRAKAALEESERKFRELSSYLLTAQERERKRISFELHDELGQSLSVLKLKLRSIERGLGNHGARLRSDHVNVFQDIDRIIENIRRLTHDLSPALLEDLGLSGALRWLVDEFAKHNNNRVFFAIEDINDFLSNEAQIIIYRIFQEALTNIGKHADAEQIFVRAEFRSGNVSLVMEDDGRGFDVNAPSTGNPDERGFGLAAMEERARMLGAALEVQSRPGHGTRIALTVPAENAKEMSGK